jgi:hypothetical protein
MVFRAAADDVTARNLLSVYLHTVYVPRVLKFLHKPKSYVNWWGSRRERDHLEDPGIDGRIIIRWFFRKWLGLNRVGSGQGQVAGTCECGIEPSGSIKCGEFLD